MAEKFALASVGALLLLAWVLPGAEEPPSANVAFVGNSITFVNDLPRFFEAISGNRIEQNSCLHGSLNFMSMLQKGNGMYNKWRTENAQIPNVNTSLYGNSPVYDFGLCTFPMLMFGYDENLDSLSQYSTDDDDANNNNNQDDDGSFIYYDDGMNPCFQDDYYMQYLTDTYRPPQWDYVVMNDQTVAPGNFYSRRKSLLALKEVYSSIFLETPSVRPVFLVTHGYVKSAEAAERSSRNITLGDVPEFTSRIYYGYELYAQTLAANLPPEQEPLLAPAGLAFLVLWEENYGMWEKLFFYDGFHPSPHGTYLIGCVLYATIFGRMPPAEYALPRDGTVGQLWSRARKMQIRTHNYPTMPLPTLEEANYLYSVAERVVLKGHLPSSLLDEETVIAIEEAAGFGQWYTVDGSN